MTELAKTFDPAAIEARWYAHWEGEGRFRPERPDAEPYTIVMPPPNVTGSLHIGHALDNSLQDILIRHARLQGKDALWVAGTDHAGIATQMVVERQMNARGEKRTDYSREDFVAKVWEWKAESGGQITRQLRRLGASCDWANERFTMDEGFSRAVIKVFVDLYNQGLLYRDKRLVNWDPGLKTAISDLEVETREVSGRFWHFAYPLEDGSGTITVATTRPETMLADMAVAVNPEDERYIALIGKNVRLPITGRLIPIVADAHADPELGSGAVKITPGHDFNDFEVGKRAGFRPADMLNMLDADAKVVQTADGLIPDEFLGLDRFDARKLVIERLKQDGVLIPHVDKDGNAHDGEPRTIQTPYGDRSGVVIEPWLTDQWYVDAETLAKPAIAAVRDGDIRVVPETWKKTWFNWLENIQPWCVSRQLWWGHQIPAWYDEDGQVYVAEDEAAAQALAGNKAITRDSDVLDTWFSSALWPFGTLGWPEDTVKLAKHYPNDVLISGFDILFFWDARMAMQGLHFMKEVPWKTLYLHGLVRDAQGQKMSKSKGNTVDPLGLIDKYGADALRFTLAAMESQGRDIKLDEKRVEGYRNFATKLWNAARFCQSNGIGASATLEPPAADLAVNRWIIAETVKTVQALDIALADLRFDESANSIYQFVWATFCDWYLELIKPLFAEEGVAAAETRAVAGWVLDQILVMLHPFMPFITEELWHALGDRPYDLIVARWPMADARALDPAAQKEIDWLIRLVGEVRAARSELNVPPGARLEAHVHDAGAETLARIDRQAAAIARLARITVSNDPAPAGGAAQVVVDEATFVLPLEGVIDIAAEKARLAKAIAAAEKERDALAKRLESPGFAEKAKPEAVAKARTDHAERSAEAERLGAALKRLG
ncbi:valine--tRNA ligase [Sphingomonas fennica]|uniref:Valine--tRNA ligase n=1 Tax=Edaphosphingomonas fennica TaxID=114404 RepID=A0A2T4I468_9SPHN|nr:valine--tRNA ligase [Sphingomonas fennica]PTD24199.1 valine--tRNA ligase [Sphingomonas fennica]